MISILCLIILASFPHVKGFHDQKVRSAGADTFVRVAVTLDGDIMLTKAHEICDKVEMEICNVIDRCDVFVHAEPYETERIQTMESEIL